MKGQPERCLATVTRRAEPRPIEVRNLSRAESFWHPSDDLGIFYGQHWSRVQRRQRAARAEKAAR